MSVGGWGSKCWPAKTNRVNSTIHHLVPPLWWAYDCPPRALCGIEIHEDSLLRKSAAQTTVCRECARELRDSGSRQRSEA